MTDTELEVHRNLTLVTAVVERGRADATVKAAIAAGARGATVTFGSGAGERERLGMLAVALDVEREIIEMVVWPRQVEAVMAAVIETAGLDRPGRGLVFTTAVEQFASRPGLLAPEEEA